MPRAEQDVLDTIADAVREAASGYYRQTDPREAATNVVAALREMGYVIVRSVDVTYACSFLLAPPTNEAGKEIVDRTIESFRGANRA